jgi:hypothetical protein
MDVGTRLIERARSLGASSIAVVGTAKNVGKTVTVAALADALQRAGIPFGLVSLGHDGESVDAVEGHAKPRLFLCPGATIATAAALLPRHPAVEVLAATGERCALGEIVLAGIRAPGYYEIAGPPSAAALRRVAGALARRVAFVAIDGAVDRIAALREGEDAIVVAAGAASGPTPQHVVADLAALLARMRLRPADADRPQVRIEGALTAGAAAALVRAGERRQVVVRDATHVAFGGGAFVRLARELDLRCERELRPIACTLAPLSAERAFEPGTFLRAAASATGFPVYDVFASAGIEPRTEARA